MIVARCDGCPVGSPGRFLGRSSLVGSGPVAEPAEVIATPGPESAVRLERDRVIPSSDDGVPVGRRSDLCGGIRVADRCLAVNVIAPGPDGAVRLECNRVVMTCANGGPVGSPGRFLSGRGLVNGGPVPEPAGVIPAPGPEGAVRLERDRVFLARIDGGPVGRPGRFLGGGVLAGGGPVAELAV